MGTKAHTNKGVVLALSCAAQFMVVLDVAIVNVALPSIQRDLGIGQSTLQWIVIAYGLMLGGFLLLGGRMADLLGRRRARLRSARHSLHRAHRRRVIKASCTIRARPVPPNATEPPWTDPSSAGVETDAFELKPSGGTTTLRSERTPRGSQRTRRSPARLRPQPLRRA